MCSLLNGRDIVVQAVSSNLSDHFWFFLAVWFHEAGAQGVVDPVLECPRPIGLRNIWSSHPVAQTQFLCVEGWFRATKHPDDVLAVKHSCECWPALRRACQLLGASSYKVCISIPKDAVWQRESLVVLLHKIAFHTSSII